MSKILCVLDGFGLLPKSPNNAAALAKMPNFKYLLKNYFWTTLNADGEQVGQEDGLVGNSEVGHMNIGGLKLVPQLSYQITKSAAHVYDLDKNITPDQLFDPKKFLTKRFEDENKTIHLIGLFSSGTIHSDLRHWAGAIEAAGKAGAEKIVMHLISDGRDSDRQSLVATWDYFVKEYEAKIKPFEGKIFLGSLGGRFYSMDRDNNWERVASGICSMVGNYGKIINRENFGLGNEIGESVVDWLKDENKKYKVNELVQHDLVDFANYFRAYEVNGSVLKTFTSDLYYSSAEFAQNAFDDYEFASMVDPKEIISIDIRESLNRITSYNYSKEVFDEMIKPLRLDNSVSRDDTVWLLNFRTDRMKEFVQVLTDINNEFELNLTIMGMNDYCIDNETYLDENFNIVRQKSGNGYYPIFKNKPVENTLAQNISENGKTQLHIAETEKYNHVTYFMNGGQNKKWEGEDWQVVDSNKVASHAEMPEMKAKEVTDYILESGLGKYDYILVNYANPDMVGHTGDIKAAITTMEFLDIQLGRLIEACEKGGHEMVIAADHGNIEKVGDYDFKGKRLIDTEHNANSVPLIILSSKFKVQSSKIEKDSVVEATTMSPLVARKADEILKQVQDDTGLVRFLDNVQKLIENKVVNLDLEQFKTVTYQKNQVELDVDSWLTEEQIPEPVLPLWYMGLILIGL